MFFLVLLTREFFIGFYFVLIYLFFAAVTNEQM